MAVAEHENYRLENPDEEFLEEFLDVAEVLLEQGDAYRSIKERRGLEKTYDELDIQEKWEYALDVVHKQQGIRYSSADELVGDVRASELDMTHLYSWGDSYGGVNEEVDDLTVTPLQDDDQVVVQARVEAEENDYAWIQLNRVDFQNRWEDFL